MLEREESLILCFFRLHPVCLLERSHDPFFIHRMVVIHLVIRSGHGVVEIRVNLVDLSRYRHWTSDHMLSMRMRWMHILHAAHLVHVWDVASHVSVEVETLSIES
jgi:hypothetical protein